MTIQQQPNAANGDETVLRLRLATLRRNLEQVADTNGSIAQRRKEINALETIFDEQDGIQLTARWLSKDVDEGIELVKKLQKTKGSTSTIERLLERLCACQKNAKMVRVRAQRSATVISAMSRRWSRLSADGIFDRHMKEIFAEKAKDLICAIDDLGEESADVAWETYEKNIAESSESLFSEYVELLSGFALRDTGLAVPLNPDENQDEEPDEDLDENQDETVPADGPADQLGPDVYMMADDLVKQLYRIGEAELWHSFTIPARRDAAACTIARMIRLGFPEWTIWAVPLSAYEFGRMVIDKNNKEIAKQYISRHGYPGYGFEIVMADVFATYALGPAYVFASVFVLLDPGSAKRPVHDDEQAVPRFRWSDAGRAFAIFRTLELMNEESEALTGVIESLRGWWQVAADQAGGAAFLDREATEKLEWLTSHIWEFLRSEAPRIQYSPRRWQDAAGWDPLGDLVSKENWRLKPGQQDVRDILSAAWYQRLAADPAQLLDPDQDQALADAALALWRRNLETRRQSNRKGY